MRIVLYLTEPYDSAITHYGLSVGRVLKGVGKDVRMAVIEGTFPHREAERYGLPVEFINFRVVNPIRFLAQLKKMYQLIKGGAVVILFRAEAAPSLLLLKKFTRARFKVIRVRGEARNIRSNLFNHWLYTKFFDRIVFTSRVMETNHVNIVPTPFTRTDVIYSPVDRKFSRVEDVDRACEIYGIGKEEKVVTVFGRLDPVKGHHIFIEAMRFLQERTKIPLRFAVVGREENVRIAELKELAGKMGVLDRFIFTGHIENPAPILSLTSVGVVSSTGSETVCRVALEFMSMGIPVVTTDVGVLPEVVEDGVNGFVVETSNPERIAESCKRIIEDEKLAASMADAARKTVEDRFSMELFGEEWNQLVEEVAE